MPDTVLEPPPHTVPAVFTRALLDWLPWLEPLARREPDRAAHGAPGRCGAGEIALFPPAGARPRRAAGAHADRQGHLLQSRCRPAAGASASWPPPRPRASTAASTAPRCMRGFAATYSKRAEDVQTLLDEGVGADLGERWNAIVAAAVALSATPIAFGSAACRAPAPRRAGRSGDRRRDPRRGVLQLGQPADAVARRAGRISRNLGQDRVRSEQSDP